jgi:hypothetical protein
LRLEFAPLEGIDADASDRLIVFQRPGGLRIQKGRAPIDIGGASSERLTGKFLAVPPQADHVTTATSTPVPRAELGFDPAAPAGCGSEAAQAGQAAFAGEEKGPTKYSATENEPPRGRFGELWLIFERLRKIPHIFNQYVIWITF